MRALVKRCLLISAGITALALGVLGAFLPMLPTVPFVLLAGYCFARSSPRLHTWLVEHRMFGGVIRNFEAGNGLPRKVKYRAILIIWLSIGVSCLLVDRVELYFMLAVIGLVVSSYLYRLPESPDATSADNEADDTQD